jgi:hypothetical protein
MDYDWFTTFLGFGLKLATGVVDGMCLEVSKKIRKKVWIYDVDLDISSACLDLVNFEKFGEDFYEVINEKGRSYNWNNRRKPVCFEGAEHQYPVKFEVHNED